MKKNAAPNRIQRLVPPFLASRWKILFAAVFVLSSLGLYNLAIGDRVRDPNQNVAEEATMNDNALRDYAGEDRFELFFQVSVIDPVREYATIAYEPVPVGRFGYSGLTDSAYAKSDFSVQYGSAAIGNNPDDGIQSEIEIQANTWIGGWSSPVNLYPCTSLDRELLEDSSVGSSKYPEDAYCFDVSLNTSEVLDGEIVGFPSFLVQYGNGIDGYKITFDRVPIGLKSYELACADGAPCTPSSSLVEGRPGACAGDDPCLVSADLENGYSRVRGFIERTEVVILFSRIVIATIVLAAVCAVAMTIAIATRIRPPALEGLAFLAGLLFAVQPLRGALPDAPPIGMDVDILVFYPSVLMILLSLVIQVGIWVRRSDYRV